MQTKYYGIYATYIEQLVVLKKQLGFKYENEGYFLSLFDKFTVSKGETKPGITKQLAEQWCLADINQSEAYKYRKVTCINQLASFLSKQGITSYIMQAPKYHYNFVLIFLPKRKSKSFLIPAIISLFNPAINRLLLVSLL